MAHTLAVPSRSEMSLIIVFIHAETLDCWCRLHQQNLQKLGEDHSYLLSIHGTHMPEQQQTIFQRNPIQLASVRLAQAHPIIDISTTET